MSPTFLEIGTKNAYTPSCISLNKYIKFFPCPFSPSMEGGGVRGKGEHMIRRMLFGLTLMAGVLSFMPPAWAQYDIAGWWSGKGTYLQGDFVTGGWASLQARGKKASYLFISQGPTSSTGTALFLIWDDISQDYLVETYNLFIRNGIIVLFVPTAFDLTSPTIDFPAGPPAGSTLVLKATGSASTVKVMNGYYTLYDMETSASPDLFVRTGPVMFTRVDVRHVPQLAKEKLPAP